MGVDRQLIQHLSSSSRFYIVTATMGAKGWARIAPAIKKAIGKGAVGKIIVGLDLLTTDYKCLKELRLLADQYSTRLEVKVFYLQKGIFHPKLTICWQKQAAKLIVGSSNLSGQAFFRNVEYDVVITAHPEIRRAEISFDTWWKHKCCYWLNNRSLDLARRLQLEGKKICNRVEKARVKHNNPNAHALAPKCIKGYTFAFTGGGLYDSSGVHWPRESRLFPLLTKLGGHFVDLPSQIEKADCIVDCTSWDGSKCADTLKVKNAADLQKLVISPRDFWKIVETDRKKRSEPKKV